MMSTAIEGCGSRCNLQLWPWRRLGRIGTAGIDEIDNNVILVSISSRIHIAPNLVLPMNESVNMAHGHSTFNGRQNSINQFVFCAYDKLVNQHEKS
jgi:hypothetical protein